MFAQVSLFFRSCLMRISSSTEAAQRLISTRVPRILKVAVQLLTSSSSTRPPSFPVFPPTPTSPTLIPGTPTLGSTTYQPPPASLVLGFGSVVVVVMAVLFTLKRLGFAEKAAAVLKTNVEKTVGTLCVVVDQTRGFVTRCIVQLSIFHQLGMALEYESNIKELVLLVASLDWPSNVWRVNISNRLAQARAIAKHTLAIWAIFINLTLTALERQDLLNLVSFLTFLVTYDISILAVIQQHIATHSRWWLLRRPDPGGNPLKGYSFATGIPSSWDGRLPDDAHDVNELWGCSRWKALKGLDLPSTFDYRCLELVQDLGQGAYGEVAKALTDTGLHIAVKKINRGPWLPRRLRRGAAGKLCMIERATILDNLLAEIQVPLAMAGHPNIIALHGVWHDAENFYVGMELGKRCLADMVMTRQRVHVFGRQLINAVKALHENGVVHLDIKPDNILANGFELKLIDFGHAYDFKVEQPHTPIFWADNGTRQCLKGIAGTKHFMSPLVETNKRYSYDADLYSVGVTLFQWITQSYAFPKFFRDGTFRHQSGQLTAAQFVFFRKIFSVTPSYRFRDWDEVLRHRIWDELDQTKSTTTRRRTTRTTTEAA
ncbi:kinase-like domain-containing protein [Mycena amicta]|nr:kinase-like domain-containing protein [Mycena amicta]